MRATCGVVIIVWVGLAGAAFAQEIKFPPNLGARATESVDVTLDSNMLQMASKFLSGSKSDEAEAKKLIGGLKGIYVKSYEFEKAGEYSEADVESVRTQLRAPGWSRIAGVHSKKDGENAEVYIKSENDKISGLAIIAAGPKELTIVSIVGQIDPNSIPAMSGRFGIPKLELQEKKKGKD
jgi:uncharacterized protein DUF4252